MLEAGTLMSGFINKRDLDLKMIRLIRKSNSLMPLISNAYTLESLKLLLHLFPKT